MSNQHPQDLAEALVRQLQQATSGVFAVGSETIQFQWGGLPAFGVQLVISADQVQYQMQSGMLTLIGDLAGTTTSSGSHSLDLPNIAVSFLYSGQIGTLDASFTTDFESQTATADITATLQGNGYSYSGQISWANSAAARLLPGETISAAASAAS